MREELEQKIYSEFPELFVQRHKTILESPMSDGLAVGDGWYHIIYESCRLIQMHIKSKADSGFVLVHAEDLADSVTDKEFEDGRFFYIPEFAQVKQKWGMLTIYIDNPDEYVSGIINLCCQMSKHICEYCGSTDIATEDRKYITLCKSCIVIPP